MHFLRLANEERLFYTLVLLRTYISSECFQDSNNLKMLLEVLTC